MTDDKKKILIAMCVISITKYLMKKENLSADQAFKKLLGTTLYKHLVDAETGLLYEPEGYLEEALNIELEYGIEQYYDFIKV